MSKDEILEAVSKMTVLELSELVKAIEEKFGVEATPAVGAVAAAPADGGAAAEEKSEFDVVLTELADPGKKIAVIKAVREITGASLGDCKALVEGAPKPVKEGVAKAEAEEMQKKITEAGGKVELK